MSRTTQVRLERSAVLALRKRALELGFVLKRGALAGDGDTAAMLEAVGRGELGIEHHREVACDAIDPQRVVGYREKSER